MTLEDAIEILELHYIALYQFLNKEYEDAVKLGIEAMKRVQECGYPARCGLMERLPGETKE